MVSVFLKRGSDTLLWLSGGVPQRGGTTEERWRRIEVRRHPRGAAFGGLTERSCCRMEPEDQE